MRRLCAFGVLVWLWAVTAQAAAPEDLPGLADEPAEPTEPAEPPTEPAEPSPPPEPTEPASLPEDAPAPAPTEPIEPPEPAPETVAPFEPTPTTSATPPPAPAPTRTTSTPPATAEPTPTRTSDDDPQGEPSEEKKDAKDEKDEKDEKDAKDEEPIKHKGFIVDFRVGVQGCTRLLCKRHDAKPGLRLDGMLGRNFFGIIDLGLAGAWGRMRTNVAPGTDGLSLYGLDPAALPPEAAALNFDQFTVNDAHFETVQAGLSLRVHVLPRGHFDPYVGIGAHYNLLRALYDTPAGETRLGFHGLAFPLQAGFVYFVHENIAVGAQLDWLWTWYGGITIRGAPGRLGAPIPLIKDQAAAAGVDLPGDLPHFWTLGGVVHIRLGK